jgi:hexosaminidase
MRALPTLVILVATIATFSLASGPAVTTDAPLVQIIPKPLSMEMSQGSFRITPETRLVVPGGNPQLRFTAEFLRDALKGAMGFSLRLVRKQPKYNYIQLTVADPAELGTEGYAFQSTPEGVTLRGGGSAGVFYAAQTLLQILPPEVYGHVRAKVPAWSLPCLSIKDRPRYGWRGMMLDVSRHFFPKAFVKKFIDGLAMHKMNTFHWHLCDDQGWRIQIKKYPKLTKISAWRTDREGMNWSVRPEQKPGEPATYGGFYTQDEIREIIAYAVARNITIVPEIEMPAHATAVIAAYPELSCTGGPFTVPTGGLWPIKDIYCAGNEKVFSFLEAVLTEVADLFPGKYIHIGGDEADKTEWKRCPKCQARIKSEQLNNEAELQSYFVKRIERFLTSRNKRLIGWDEILEGGLAPDATVMSWRGIVGGIEAAKSGHDVVMAPTSNCYFDYYQGDWRTEPVAIGGYLPIQTVYAYEPTPDTLTDSEATHILGTQANLWAEFIPDPAKSEYVTYPRIAAIAEVGWTAKALRNWDDFALRLETQMARYTHRGIHASRAAFTPVLQDTFDTATRTRIVRLHAEIGQDRIRYTRDGEQPTPNSLLYSSPLILSAGETISAATFSGPSQLGETTQREYFVTPGEPPVVASMTPLDSPYVRGSLTGNVRATGGSRDPEWMGVKGKDFDALLDLGGVRSLNRLAAGFFQSPYELIFLPETVTFELSENGETFTAVATAHNDVSARTQQALMKDFVASFKPLKARYIRMKARSLKVCPEWQKQAGEPVWMLFDELFAE